MRLILRVPGGESAMFPGWGLGMRAAWFAVVGGCVIAAVLMRPSVRRLEQLTDFGVLTGGVTPLAGGAYVYSTSRGSANGQPALWIGDRLIAADAVEPDAAPGKPVVYRSLRGGLYADGKLIAGDGREPRYSPGGSKLAWTGDAGAYVDGALVAAGASRPVWFDNARLLVEKDGAWWTGQTRIGPAPGRAQFVAGGEIHYLARGALWAGGRIVAEHPDGIAWARVAADGSLYFATERRTIDAWSMPVDGDTIGVRGRPERLTTQGDVRLPAMSGDGSRLAYVTGKSEVRVRNLHSGNEDRITEMTGRGRPVLNYDGSQIALPLRDGAGCRISISSTVVFAETGSVSECAALWDWAPDGRRMLLSASPARLELADPGGRWTVIEDPARPVTHAHFAPSGRFISFTAGERRRTFVAPLPAGVAIDDMAWLEVRGSRGGYPAWSPNGRVLYYHSASGGVDEIWAQLLDAVKRPVGAPVRVLRFGSREFSTAGVGDDAFHLSVSRERLVFNAVEVRGEIWRTSLR